MPAKKTTPAKPAAKAAPATKAKPAAAAAAPAEDAEPKKHRVQLATVLGIGISQARCATHLKYYLGDEAVEAEIKELRAEVKAATEAKEEAKVADLKAQISEKSKTLVRTSSGTPIAAATMMNSLVIELIRYGMDQAIAGQRKIVEVAHLHENSPESLSLYPLFDKCASWAGYDPAHEEELKKQRTAQNKAAKDAREAKKKAAEEEEKAGGKPAAKTPAKAAPAADADDGESGGVKTTFNTYVENTLKTVKAEELPDGTKPYATMRVSNRVREYISDMVAEAIARLACLARIIVTYAMDVRTMNADHIKVVVRMLLTDAGRSEDQIEEVTQQIDDKLKIYHDHLESEKAKKAEELTDEKKAEIAQKKAETEIARKKKQADMAAKRAVESAEKAKALRAETAKLEAATK